MIRRTATSDTSALDAQINMLTRHEEVVAAAGQKAYDETAPKALALLRQEPGPVKYTNDGKLDWTSDSQRIAVMIKYRKMGIEKWERGKHGKRLSEQWEITAKTEQGVFTFTVFNPSSIAKFVYGSMAKNANAASRFQQRFHRATGWLNASEEGQKVVVMLNAAFKRFYRLEVVTRTRAYTKGMRRS